MVRVFIFFCTLLKPKVSPRGIFLAPCPPPAAWHTPISLYRSELEKELSFPSLITLPSLTKTHKGTKTHILHTRLRRYVVYM